ncbi:peptidase family M28-domain-containing protein [Suillus bovinus]|uniref:peptidase family M28-domain-containing protein n=1 Tax=Suillus bovinus TaxID=48563 RepID=UPI001B85D48C|nr:peptidase family M28-domain-containing protein [Suillus bovinus]KAG2142730.1 peptidase family M28-domain-containing protein [Suillus bovinus]
MGVVTLLSMVKYFAENRPSRMVVFNINNGEEDGLNGAHVFMEHSMGNVTDTFLNLEGAAAGGRPLLFRTTSRAPLASWSTSHPHANVLTGDAFSRGVIRSGTDYSVYEQAGLKGLDFAFYRGRSRYHTKYDSIPGMSGDKSKNALCAMMEGTLFSSLVLANDVKGKTRTESIGQGSEPVYFDLFGTIMIMFTFQTLRIANIVLLIVGPVILLMLVYFEHIIRVASRIRSGHYRAANGNVHRESFVVRASAEIKHFLKSFWVWFKFWTALLLGVAFQMLLVVGYVKLNPFVIHTHPWLVLVSALSLAYLTTALALTFPLTKHGVVPAPEQQKLSILLHQYVLTWAPLVYATSAMTLGGTYFITVWNAVVFLGAVLACVEGMAGARGYKDEGEIQGQRCYVRGVHYDVVDTAENGHQRAGIIEETEPTEITRLVAQHGQSRPLGQEQGAII